MKPGILLALGFFVLLGSALAQTSIPLKAYCYSLPRADALGFILTHNPTGQPGESMEALDSLVKEKKAALAATATLSADPGQRTSLKESDLNLEAEISASPDRSVYDVTCKASYRGADLMGRSLLAPNQFAFFGLIPNTSDPDSVLLVYLFISS